MLESTHALIKRAEKLSALAWAGSKTHLEAAQAHTAAARAAKKDVTLFGPVGGYRSDLYLSREHFDKAATHRETHAKVSMTGARGGVYEISKTGKKHYIGHHNVQKHGGLKHR